MNIYTIKEDGTIAKGTEVELLDDGLTHAIIVGAAKRRFVEVLGTAGFIESADIAVGSHRVYLLETDKDSRDDGMIILVLRTPAGHDVAGRLTGWLYRGKIYSTREVAEEAKAYWREDLPIVPDFSDFEPDYCIVCTYEETNNAETLRGVFMSECDYRFCIVNKETREFTEYEIASKDGGCEVKVLRRWGGREQQH